MAVKFVFKVGPRHHNSDYAHKITVIADGYDEGRRKAIEYRGFRPGDATTWFVSADEIEPSEEILDRLITRLEKTLDKDKI